MSKGIVEIRDYTIEEKWFPKYKEWATELAAPWLKNNLDVIDFWMDSGIPSEVTGSSPQTSQNVQANVCWIIRWPSKESREAGFKAFGKNPEWQEIWSKHPNPNAYLQMNVRFMEAAAN